MAVHYYFAYGSRMNAAEMNRICRAPKLLGTARLDGWRLAFTHSSPAGSGMADMIQIGSGFDTESRDVPGLVRVRGQALLSPVWGVLWELDDKDRAALDKHVGFSPKDPPEQAVLAATQITVMLTGKTTRRIASFAYTVRRKANHIDPSPDYMKVLMEGAFSASLPSIYTGQLAKVPLRRGM